MQNCLPEGGFDKFDAGDLAEGNIQIYDSMWVTDEYSIDYNKFP